MTCVVVLCHSLDVILYVMVASPAAELYTIIAPHDAVLANAVVREALQWMCLKTYCR
jgi:hypothetical protein